VQQSAPIPQNNEDMLPSRPSSAIGTNIFGDIWISHKSLSYFDISSRGQTPRFHTLGSIQGLEVEMDEHRKTTSMFHHATQYNTHMTIILFGLFEMETKNKQIVEEKNKYVLNFQKVLEKE
jgi:hypothetical protein